MTYNGTPVVYVPSEFAEKGYYTGTTQYLQPGYLNRDVWSFMKPARVDASVVSNTAAAPLISRFQDPYNGYIIDESKFRELSLNNPVRQYGQWSTLGKANPPVTGIGENNGKLVYVGKSGDDRNGELVTYDPSGTGQLYAHTSESSFWGDVGRTLGKLGPATLLLNAVVPGLGTAVYVGTNVGQAVSTGNWGRAALNIALTSVPGAGGVGEAAGTLFEIPAVANSVQTISSTLGVSAATAGAIVNGAVNLLANGGNLKDALATTLAQQIGAQAANFASDFAGLQGMRGLDSIIKNVTKESTTALLLNRDVESTAKNAFIGSAIPAALQSTPGWEKLSSQQQGAITAAATSAARGGQMDIGSALKTFTSQVFADAAVDAIGGDLTESQKRLARDTIVNGIQGKPLDSSLQSFLIGEARTAIKNQVAQSEGWKDDVQKQQAVRLYGDKIDPNDYSAKQQGWEDYSEKQAAIKLYGDTVTPLGFKEREQVKSIDPGFDAEAYAKLNEVTGDPFQHFLEQGQKSNLPTNYEKGAEAALASLGYKPESSEIKEVASLLKSSAEPDAALGKYYDERWVSQEEAAAAAKDAGFDLTPEQLAKFTGQARSGQNAVFEDIATAANIGKAAQQQRSTYIENYLADVTKAYKEQGYTEAQIAAAMPEIRANISKSTEKYVEQLDVYAKQALNAYGPQSQQYADAQKKLLDTKASVGGYGVVKEESAYKTALGDLLPADEPTQASTWLSDKTKAVPAPVTPGDRLILSGGAGTPSLASEAIRKELSAIGIPGQGVPLTSPEGAQKSAFIGEVPSGAGQGKVPTLFGIPLSASFADVGGDNWVRVDQNKWVTPDNKYTFLSLPGGGEVRDVQTQNIVAKLTPEQTAQIAPAAPVVPPAPQESVTQTVQDIIKAADEKRISPQEAQAALEAAIGSAGYKATPEEIQQQVAMLQGEKTQEQVQKEAEQYIAARMVTPDEVRQMYRELGLQQPTEADITRFTGQRMQSEMPDILKSYLPTASANVISMQAQKDAERQQAIDAQIAGLAGSTQSQFGDVNSRILQLQQQGMSQSEATSKALQELASGQAGLGQQIGAVQTGLGQQIGGLGQQVGGISQALSGLAGAVGTKTQGLQQQIQQAQQQANFGNLLTLIGIAGKEQKAPPLELVGKITPYQFSDDLLAGIYKPNTINTYQANDQLLNLTKGLS